MQKIEGLQNEYYEKTGHIHINNRRWTNAMDKIPRVKNKIFLRGFFQLWSTSREYLAREEEYVVDDVPGWNFHQPGLISHVLLRGYFCCFQSVSVAPETP